MMLLLSLVTLATLFDRADVVAVGLTHGSRQDHDLSLQILRDPGVRERVRNVVVEWGNSLYQGTLDRYVAGEPVAPGELARVWQDTTQSPLLGMTSCKICLELLDEVRAYNRQVTAGRRMRVLAGDPPIDWKKVTSSSDFTGFLAQRDEVPARVVRTEVLDKGQKALVLYGAGHIWRGNVLMKKPNLVALLEQTYPGRVVTLIRLSGEYSASSQLDDAVSGAALPILFELKAHAAGKLDANTFVGRGFPVKLFEEGFPLSRVADYALYLGRGADSTLPNDVPDPALADEMARRKAFLPSRR